MKKFLLLFLIVGCTPRYYMHSTKTEQQFAKDLTECQAKAGMASIGVYDPYGWWRDSVIQECMIGYGWHQVKED